MDIKEVQQTLQNLTGQKIKLVEIARALEKDRSNIHNKAKKGTELKLSEIQKIEKYFNVTLVNTKIPFPKPQNSLMKNLGQPDIFKNLNIHKEIEKINNDIIFDEYENLCNSIITLDYVSLNPSCGNGTYAYEDAEITPITLGTALIKDIFKISKPHDLKIFKASGDSMEQTIYDNDLLLVNTSIKEYQSSGIYILYKNNEYFCKRLNLLINGNLEIISDNSKYRIEIIDNNTEIELKILGKVIKNLSRGL